MKITKQITLIFLSILLIPLLSDCTDDIVGPEFNLDEYNNPYYKILSINDSTVIRSTLDLGEHKDDNFLTYKWTSNIGVVEGTGNSIVYYAPGKNGMATIELIITDSDSNNYYETFTIKIFQQLIILKADDFVYDYQKVISSRWKRFIDFIAHKNIKASLGIVGNSINYGNDEFYESTKKINSSGYFEFWNHGYSHKLNATNIQGEKYCEFQGTPVEYQKAHLLRTQKLAKERLGIDLHAFGAPGNAIDINTITTVDETSEINIWFFGFEEYTKLVLERTVDIEFPTFNPDYEKFINNYRSEKEYLVLQIHPNSWDRDQFAEFEKIIDYLISQDVMFVTPSEYHDLLN